MAKILLILIYDEFIPIWKVNEIKSKMESTRILD